MNDQKTAELYAYLDGALTAGEVVRLEEGLRSDPALKAELDAMRAADDALQALPAAPSDAAFTERFLVATRRRRGGLLLRLAAPLAAAAALVFVVNLGSDEVSPPVPSPEVTPYNWEEDQSTYVGLDLGDLEAEILEDLETT